MGRIYRVTFSNVVVAAAQDLLQVKGASGKILKIREWWYGATDTTLVTAQGLRSRSRYLPATVTDGSGGTTPTPAKTDPGDAAASFTALANNTTPATSSGTAIVLDESGDHIYNGYRKQWRAGAEPTIGPSESWVGELLSTMSGTVHLSGGVEVEEMGG